MKTLKISIAIVFMFTFLVFVIAPANAQSVQCAAGTGVNGIACVEICPNPGPYGICPGPTGIIDSINENSNIIFAIMFIFLALGTAFYTNGTFLKNKIK